MRSCSSAVMRFPGIRFRRAIHFVSELAVAASGKIVRHMRNVIVTGGSRGLGLGIARKLAAAGYRVIALARKESDQLTSAMEEAERANPGSFHFVPFDLANIEEIAQLVKNLRKEFGPDLRPGKQRGH